MDLEHKLDKALGDTIKTSGCKLVSDDKKEKVRDKEFLTAIFNKVGYPYQDTPKEYLT